MQCAKPRGPIGGAADSAGCCFNAAADRLAFASGREAWLIDLKAGAVVQRWQLVRGFGDELQFDERGRLLLLRCEQDRQTNRWLWRLAELPAGSQTPLPLLEQKDTTWSSAGVALAPLDTSVLRVGL